jgi:hypothetical protein
LQRSQFCPLSVDFSPLAKSIAQHSSRSNCKTFKRKFGHIADSYANVSVLFADIVDFKKLSGNISPEKLVDLLNNIFSKFDELAEIKTIGDAYMVVAGLPEQLNDQK